MGQFTNNEKLKLTFGCQFLRFSIGGFVGAIWGRKRAVSVIREFKSINHVITMDRFGRRNVNACLVNWLKVILIRRDTIRAIIWFLDESQCVCQCPVVDNLLRFIESPHFTGCIIERVV